MSSNPVFINSRAKTYKHTDTFERDDIRRLHKSLPGFQATPLISLPDLAAELGVKHVFVKDESSRAGLPAFKILGASWGVFRAVTQRAELSLSSTLEEVGAAARSLHLTLVAATEGNHGRAVARIGSLLGIPTRIYASDHMYEYTRLKIREEKAELTIVDGDYDAAVAAAHTATEQLTGGILVQDNAFEGYETIPAWIVQGYSTLLAEITDEQLPTHHDESKPVHATHIVTPIGVGSLGHAVVTHCKSHGRGICVVAVEPETAACLYHGMRAGRPAAIETAPTIMAGMHCATVSPISWPVLQAGVDVCVTVTDVEAHHAVEYLRGEGIDAGPCGGASVAALRRVLAEAPEEAALGPDAVVVLLSTEGNRDYPIPE